MIPRSRLDECQEVVVDHRSGCFLQALLGFRYKIEQVVIDLALMRRA
jgi:hypothetical protein